jgi:hypothetical protein
MQYPDFLKRAPESDAEPIEPETRWQRIRKKIAAALLGLLQGIIAGC